MPTYFVAGTDTDIGKTFTAVALLYGARAAGMSTLGLKPIAAGCELSNEGLRNADALALLAASSVPGLRYEEINPVALADACAPHIAAERAGRRLTIAQLTGYVRGGLSRRADFMLVEGAGGWRVPISDREMLSALPKALQIPVILVIGLRLGCLSVAFLTTEAILKDGLRIAGWVGNSLEADMAFSDENVATLKRWLPMPCLGIIPRLNDIEPALQAHVAASYLDLSLLVPIKSV